MRHAFELCVGINHTYIQPAVCKSPTAREVSIEDVEVLPDKLTEQGIHNSFYYLQRNTQTAINDTLLYMHNPRHKKGDFTFSARNFLLVLLF